MLHNLDSDSSKIIEAVRSTGVVVTEAMRLYVDYIVSNMKAIGTWDLCNAVYGFVGGTEGGHKWNWKDTRDVDAAFRLSFPNGMTHSTNGIVGNGTTQYAETFLNPSSSGLVLNNTHLAIYTRDDTQSNLGAISIGANLSGSIWQFGPSYSGTIFSDCYNTSTGRLSLALTNQRRGFWLQNRQSSTSHKILKNGIVLASNSTTGGSLPNTSFFLMAQSSNGVATNYSNRNIAFSTIGSGLTDTQAIQQSQIITNAQNILNRA